MSENELLPCPFCGNAPSPYFDLEINEQHISGKHWCARVKCGCNVKAPYREMGETKEDAELIAIKVWNQRSDDRIAQLEAANREMVDRASEFRDSVLNWRHQLEEGTIDSDQTNAVLGLFDDTMGNALTQADALLVGDVEEGN